MAPASRRESRRGPEPQPNLNRRDQPKPSPNDVALDRALRALAGPAATIHLADDGSLHPAIAFAREDRPAPLQLDPRPR